MNDDQSQSEGLPAERAAAELEARGRRDFLLSLGKWSKAVIGGVVLGGALLPGQEAKAWYNGPGVGWGVWVEPSWDWYNRPRWYNRSRWYNRPYWRDRDWEWDDRPRRRRRWYNGPGWRDGWYNR